MGVLWWNTPCLMEGICHIRELRSLIYWRRIRVSRHLQVILLYLRSLDYYYLLDKFDKYQPNCIRGRLRENTRVFYLVRPLNYSRSLQE